MTKLDRIKAETSKLVRTVNWDDVEWLLRAVELAKVAIGPSNEDPRTQKCTCDRCRWFRMMEEE